MTTAGHNAHREDCDCSACEASRAPNVWVAATCPSWCDRDHPAILVPHAMADDITEALVRARVIDDGVEHFAELGTSPDGLAVRLSAWEDYPGHRGELVPSSWAAQPRLYVELPTTHENAGASPATLRSWAAVLNAAADAAEPLALWVHREEAEGGASERDSQ